MIVRELKEDVYNLILNKLHYAKEKNEIELNKMKQIHMPVVDTRNRLMNIETSIHYSNSNNELYNLLHKEFGNEDLVLDCFYKFKYNVGDFANPHYDGYSHQTSILLLSDEFTGGDFFINDKKVDFNKKGKYIQFNSEQIHSVSEIISGYREVLVMLFQKTKTLL